MQGRVDAPPQARTAQANYETDKLHKKQQKQSSDDDQEKDSSS